MSEALKEFELLIKKQNIQNRPVMVHSDLFWTSRLFLDLKKAKHENIITQHRELLNKILPTNSIWHPSFNYDFCKGIPYNSLATKSQLGPLSEHIRNQKDSWRTLDPIFSFTGTNLAPIINYDFNNLFPFDENSLFGKLVSLDGYLLFYGASFHSVTMIHHIEHMAGGPLYRYDKIFKGQIINSSTDEINETKYTYHVRPHNHTLNYDWARLEKELINNGIAQTIQFKNKNIILLIRVKALFEYWHTQITEDPFFLLDSPSRDWVMPKINKLGRRFELTDFE